MISMPLLKREAKANYKLLLIFMGVLTLYASMIIAMFDPKLGESLALMAESMPGIFSAFGMTNVSTTLVEFCANYLYGFLMVVFPLVFIIILANKLVARYVDRGSMAYLLASPIKRGKLIFTQMKILCGALFLLVAYVTILSLLVGEMMFPGEMDVAKFISLNLGCYCLHIFLAGVCFLPSCIFNDSKYATGTGAGVCIAFVLIQMISQVGEKFENLKYITPLTLFDTAKILAADSAALWQCGTLLVAGLALMFVGLAIFCKRDIPV